MTHSYIHSISNVVPEFRYSQHTIAQAMKNVYPDNRLMQRSIHHLYANSGISYRHSVLDELMPNGTPEFFTTFAAPTTGERNALYTRFAKSLFVSAAAQALQDAKVASSEISHVITVSCTGFYAPGPDYDIIQGLELSSQVQRYHIGFMGCFGAFPALRLADTICKAQPDATVLISIVELCTLHLQLKDTPDTLIANSVFADGATACVVRAHKNPHRTIQLRIDHTASELLAKGEQEMAWTIGDHGFDMKLSSYVPDLIQAHIGEALQKPLLNQEISLNDVHHWAIHPGGRAIIDNVQKALYLSDDQTTPSREILQQYGNMSAATVLFVMKHIWEKANSGERMMAMAFGPGLTIETATLFFSS